MFYYIISLFNLLNYDLQRTCFTNQCKLCFMWKTGARETRAILSIGNRMCIVLLI